MRIYGLTVQNRIGAIALGIAALAAGGVFLVFGIALLVAVSVVGLTLGAGVMVYRRLTGRGVLQTGGGARAIRLDPSKEVFPADPSPQSIGAASSQHGVAQDRDES